MNAGMARLVAAVRVLLETEGWAGPGIRSPEHWLTWKAGVSRARAEGLVCIARRAGDLPACWTLFEQGRLGEDAMVRIARRVPARRDAQVAELAPQLDRVLRSLPERPDGDGERGRAEPARMCRLPNRALRRYLARRDQGCVHPTCTQRRWLHAHHIVHWEHGGSTIPANLVLMCPYHHRALHQGAFNVTGDPEAGTLRVLDRFDRPIGPPGQPPPGHAPPGHPPPGTGSFTPPLAEPLPTHSFTWN